MDTYAYMPLPAGQPLVVDVERELYKHHELDDYVVSDFDKTDQSRLNICTRQQLELFHKTLFSDLYRRDREINFSVREEEKKYYIVPIILKDFQGSKLAYDIDHELLLEVEQIALHGYAKCQQNILGWLQSNGIDPLKMPKERDELLENHMLVKADKPNSCYHYDTLIGDLQNISAEDLAKALRCST